MNGQKGYDDHLYVVNNGFLTNYLMDLIFETIDSFYSIKLRGKSISAKYSMVGI